MRPYRIIILASLTLSTAISFAQGLHHAISENEEFLKLRPYEQMLMKPSKVPMRYQMESIEISDGYSNTTFSYNSQQQMIALYQEEAGMYDHYDSIHYNDAGQMIRIDGYLLINNQQTHAYYILYEYNSEGLMSSRTNYNKMDDEFQLGGIYEYTYNNHGQIVRSVLTMARMSAPFQKTEYYYQDGLLHDEIWYLYESTTWVPSQKLTYQHNDDNKPVTIHDSVWNGNSYEFTGQKNYEYDANGNCERVSTYDRFRNEITRSEYEYTNYSMSETLVPYLPEELRPENLGNTHAYSVEHWYQLDAEQHFGYAWDYIYHYSDHVSIEGASSSNLKIYPNPATDLLVIDGLENEMIEFYDITGTMVLSQRLSNGTLDVSYLPSGSYVLHIPSLCSSTTVVVSK